MNPIARHLTVMALTSASFLTLSACNSPQTATDLTELDRAPANVQAAFNQLRGGISTQAIKAENLEASLAFGEIKLAGGEIVGEILFYQDQHGTYILTGIAPDSTLVPGKHGMHVHRDGNCTDTTDATGKVTVFGGAGPHFDPFTTGKHGGLMDANTVSHAGDLGNLRVQAAGDAFRVLFTRKLMVTDSQTSVVNRGLVLHALEDDQVSQPIGNAGGRLACASIQGI
jgi:superoxide dismutase, Cu-Zn family